MSIFGWLDLALIAVVVITLATYLYRIIRQLQHVTFTLGTIIAGVAAIANQTQTVPPVVSNVNNNLLRFVQRPMPSRAGPEAAGADTRRTEGSAARQGRSRENQRRHRYGRKEVERMHLLASLMASPTQANLTGWYIGFVITTVTIVIVVIEVQAILVIARNIGVQAQEAIRGLEACWTNTAPLWDLQTTIDHASAIVNDLLTVRKSLGG